MRLGNPLYSLLLCILYMFATIKDSGLSKPTIMLWLSKYLYLISQTDDTQFIHWILSVTQMVLQYFHRI